MLEIHYNKNDQLIQISLHKNQEYWPAIRSVFEEYAEEITSVSAFSLSLPVWSFLSCRKPLVYVLKRILE